MTSDRFDVGPVLGQLKDFQRASVEHVFTQLYERGADKFLVADEVGLGKTLVARGLIAKAVDHLWDDVERIDVIYICSNAGIAQQNIRRLNVVPDQGFSFSSRMTMIARQAAQLNGNRVNFVSFTPGTSFDLKSNTGMSEERVLLYWLVHHIWGAAAVSSPGAQRLFKCSVGDANWPRYLRAGELLRASLDTQLLAAFEEDLIELRARERFDDIAPCFTAHDSQGTPVARTLRDGLIGELRERLAKLCVHTLKPDLVILDEFQRFRHLMSDEDPAGQLAQSLFDFAGNKTLLLSATPYKMFTNGDDTDDNHHSDFTQTVKFLSPDRISQCDTAMAEFRAGILDIRQRTAADLAILRCRVEAELSNVMVRTERLGAGSDRNGMLVEVPAVAPLRTGDVTAFVALEAVATLVGAQGMIEYWKSVPSFLNFCDGYRADQQVAAALADGATRREALRQLRALDDRIEWGAWRRFEPLDTGNGRYRILEQQTVDNEAWRMLWIAPALPYHSLGGPWAGERSQFTKRLIFSSWAGVPKSVSSLLSYEVERRMFGMRPEPIDNTPEARRTIQGRLPFARDQQGRPGSMNSFAFVYPCVTLSRIADPLAAAREYGRTLRFDEMQAIVRAQIAHALQQVVVDEDTTVVGDDKRWYWAAPLLLDRVDDAVPQMRNNAEHEMAWVGGAATDDDETTSHEVFNEHIDLASAMYRNEIPLGRQPDDLLDVLVDLALGSPATVALRSIGHVLGDGMPDEHQWEGACRIGWAFRSLFNLPDVNSLIRSADWGQDYWRTATRYCAEGCLTAVLDEYLHVLREAVGVYEINMVDPGGDMLEIASAVQEAIGIRTTSLVARDHLGEADTTPRFRTRYAMRFGNDRDQSETSMVTAAHLRRAFNSPFWPFVLTSTSIGQEGLDFHLYCHAIMHWNLPSNPVDLEQREGRVHRFKGHAVRRNLAAAMVDAAWASVDDPWDEMFNAAAEARPDTENELMPYWVYPGDAKIERHVPMLPFSREVGQLARLKRDVARYRLVFGQPRQDDLLEYLGDVPPDKLAELRIDLSPRT